MIEDLLKRVPLFSSLDNAALHELAAYLKKESYAPHHTIFLMDEKSDHLYIVANGKVRISFVDEAGKDITLAVLGRGAFFGELSLIDQGPHSATALSLTETELLTLDRASFYLFLNKHPQLGHTLLEVLAARLRSKTPRLHSVINVNEELEAKKSSFQHFVDKLAKALTGSIFIRLYILFICVWIAVQVILYKKNHLGSISFLDHPPTFFILGFFITLTSFLLTILILNSQRRQAEEDRVRSELEYRVNLKSQAEVMKLKLKMDQLIEMVGKLTNEKTTDDEEEHSFI